MVQLSYMDCLCPNIFESGGKKISTKWFSFILPQVCHSRICGIAFSKSYFVFKILIFMN